MRKASGGQRKTGQRPWEARPGGLPISTHRRRHLLRQQIQHSQRVVSSGSANFHLDKTNEKRYPPGIRRVAGIRRNHSLGFGGGYAALGGLRTLTLASLGLSLRKPQRILSQSRILLLTYKSFLMLFLRMKLGNTRDKSCTRFMATSCPDSQYKAFCDR